MNMNAEMFASQESGATQFKLARIQTFNWGTFDGVLDFPIPEEGFLFVGPSGSGKSTILDAHAALLTPPRWADFNVAARESDRHGKDRNAVTYIRGAWAEQTGDGGEYLSQYLRSCTTWSAIAETYRNGEGRCVVLAQLLWIRGKSNATSDVHKLYLVLERDFDIRELEFFPKADFEVRKVRPALPDAYVTNEFPAYQERFRRMLGIESELALRLLHKTQSAKNLGDLNMFLRDFMLDVPETFRIAEQLVNEFVELNAAHQAVVAARQQIDILKPAKENHDLLVKEQGKRSVLDELSIGVDFYREHQLQSLLLARKAEREVELEGARQAAAQLADKQNLEFDTLRDLQDKLQDSGGRQIEQLVNQKQEAETEREARLKKRTLAESACKPLDWTLPVDPTAFAQLAGTAKQNLLGASDAKQVLVEQRDKLIIARQGAEQAFKDATAEATSLARQRSNIPGHMLEVRAALAAATRIPEEKLPFVGELLEVRKEDRQWQGAIERLLHGFALSLVVDDKYYAPVSAYLNKQHIGQRLVYLRVLPQQTSQKTLYPNSAIHKLSVARSPFAEWVLEQLRSGFDYACVDSPEALRAVPRGITMQGQIKHNASRHEKDDRRRVDDPGNRVLGFDNADKRAHFETLAAELAAKYEALRKDVETVGTKLNKQDAQALHWQSLSNLVWADIDVGSILTKIASLTERIASERGARPALAKIEKAIVAQETVYGKAVKSKNAADGTVAEKVKDIAELSKKLAGLRAEFLSVLSPHQATGLAERYAAASRPLTLESLDQITTQVTKGLGADKSALIEEIGQLRTAIERQFTEFNRAWLAESGGLDATLQSADDYFAKLHRLETDGLPKFEERFFTLLREQSDQNLSLLQNCISQERKAIIDRLVDVNESLLAAPYNPGTHLVIHTMERPLEDVKVFKASLRDALSHSFTDDKVLAEAQFNALKALVTKLGSQETADKNWRALVLDVRQHVEFVARELDSNDGEVEIYRSGAGKSGGQRQKLAASCLAAALRYQLGGQDRTLPSFSTVVLDEAFDKADNEFTETAMNIFKTFGFQMIVATPMKSVMTLEPFIGGACFVHIRDRKHSSVMQIEYDTASHRLNLSSHPNEPQEAAVSV
jgi:uncharacterized protein YPO0396